MELKRVVVTGLGAITPVGNSVPEFWENLVNGVSGAGPITHFDASLFKTQFACEVKDFDATKYIDRKEARKMDLYTQYAIAVAKEAVSDLKVLQMLHEYPLLTEDGIIIMEHAIEDKLPSDFHQYTLLRNQKYGSTTQISIYELKSNKSED